MIWDIKKQDKNTVKKISRNFVISDILSRLIVNRGFTDIDAVNRFLSAKPKYLYDPYLLTGMDKTVDRLQRAFNNKEKFFVFGDYDVDGITSIGVFTTLLLSARVPFEIYQPDRLKEGYGLNETGIELAVKSGASVLVTLDCGTEAYNLVEKTIRKGIDVIIIDHHKQKGDLPPASAILNPNRNNSTYPFKELSAVGVVFKLVQAAAEKWDLKLPREKIWMLTALGTVADVVPLIDENRIFVKYGLKYIKENKDPLFRGLINASGSNAETIDAEGIAFQIAPRLNAAGRMGKIYKCANLLFTEDSAEIDKIAMDLDLLNRKRRAFQALIVGEIKDKITELPEKYLNNVIVVEGEGWSKGIIGIAAAKILEEYYRPVIVISLQDDKGVGSARSIPGFNIFDAINYAGEYLEKYGGHKQAAGITVKKANISNFRKSINEYSKKIITPEMMTPKIEIDAELELKDVNLSLVKELAKLEPYGNGNPVPLFCTKELSLKNRPYIMGKTKKHLKLVFGDNKLRREFIWWNMAEHSGKFKETSVDIVYTPKINNWNNSEKLQLIINDVRKSAEQ